MAWYRFHANDKSDLSPPIFKEEEEYFYFSECEGDQAVKEEWSLWTARLGINFGLGLSDDEAEYAKVEVLPEETRDRLLNHHNNVIDDAQRMIDVLLETPVAKEQGE